MPYFFRLAARLAPPFFAVFRPPRRAAPAALILMARLRPPFFAADLAGASLRAAPRRLAAVFFAPLFFAALLLAGVCAAVFAPLAALFFAAAVRAFAALRACTRAFWMRGVLGEGSSAPRAREITSEMVDVIPLVTASIPLATVPMAPPMAALAALILVGWSGRGSTSSTSSTKSSSGKLSMRRHYSANSADPYAVFARFNDSTRSKVQFTLVSTGPTRIAPITRTQDATQITRISRPEVAAASATLAIVEQHAAFMRLALEYAERGRAVGEVPVGAVVVAAGDVVAGGWNQPITAVDPTAHAEIVALRAAAKAVGNYRLGGATLYVTIEPCLMCVGAMIHARVGLVVYGAAEPRAGALASAVRAHETAGLNHRLEVLGGVLEEDCRAIMQQFFRERR